MEKFSELEKKNLCSKLLTWAKNSIKLVVQIEHTCFGAWKSFFFWISSAHISIEMSRVSPVADDKFLQF